MLLLASAGCRLGYEELTPEGELPAGTEVASATGGTAADAAGGSLPAGGGDGGRSSPAVGGMQAAGGEVPAASGGMGEGQAPVTGGMAPGNLAGAAGGGPEGVLPAGCFDVPGCSCVETGGSRYQYCAGPADLLESGVACGLLGGLRAQIGDEAENEAVRAGAAQVGLLGPGQSIALGGTDVVEEGVWRWADFSIFWDGVPGSTYTNWATAPVDDALDCMAMTSDGRWSEFSCSEQRSFVCELL